jgi:putative addiction module component (TIGR02574 family)
MNEIIFLVEEAVEGGYTAKAVGESIFVEGDTLETLRANVIDALNCHFEPDQKPEFLQLQWAAPCLSEEQMKELGRRLEEHRNNPNEAIPWEVEKEIFGDDTATRVPTKPLFFAVPPRSICPTLERWNTWNTPAYHLPNCPDLPILVSYKLTALLELFITRIII